MPMKSKAQNRAMHAAASGKSNLGIPKKVGKEFVNAQHGKSVKGLPETKSPLKNVKKDQRNRSTPKRKG